MGGKNYMLVYMLNKHEKPLMPGNLPERHEYKLGNHQIRKNLIHTRQNQKPNPSGLFDYEKRKKIWKNKSLWID